MKPGDKVYVLGTVVEVPGTGRIIVKMPDGNNYRWTCNLSLADPNAAAVETLDELMKEWNLSDTMDMLTLVRARLASLKPKPEPVPLTFDEWCNSDAASVYRVRGGKHMSLSNVDIIMDTVTGLYSRGPWFRKEATQ